MINILNPIQAICKNLLNRLENREQRRPNRTKGGVFIYNTVKGGTSVQPVDWLFHASEKRLIKVDDKKSTTIAAFSARFLSSSLR